MNDLVWINRAKGLLKAELRKKILLMKNLLFN